MSVASPASTTLSKKGSLPIQLRFLAESAALSVDLDQPLHQHLATQAYILSRIPCSTVLITQLTTQALRRRTKLLLP